MALDLIDGRGERIIVAVNGVRGILFRCDGHHVRPLVVERAQVLSDVRIVRDGLGDDIGRARKRLFDGGDALFFVHVFFGGLLGHGTVGLLRIEQFRKGCKSLFPRDRGARAALLFIGTVDVLDLGKRLGLVDRGRELFGELALILNGILYLLPPRFQIAQVGQAVGKGADRLIVHRAVHFLAVARDERHGVPLVQQRYDILHIVLALAELFCQNLGDRLHVFSPSVCRIQ